MQQNFNVPIGKTLITLTFRLSPPGTLLNKFSAFLFEVILPGLTNTNVKGCYYKGVSVEDGNQFDFQAGVVGQRVERDYKGDGTFDIVSECIF